MTNEGVPISRDMLVALECVLLRRMHNGTIKTIRWKVVKDGQLNVHEQHHGMSAMSLLLRAGDVETNPGPVHLPTVTTTLDQRQAATLLGSCEDLGRDVRQHTTRVVMNNPNLSDSSAFKLDLESGDMMISHLAITWGIDALLWELRCVNHWEALRVLGAFSGVVRVQVRAIPEHDWDQQLVEMGLQPFSDLALPWHGITKLNKSSDL